MPPLLMQRTTRYRSAKVDPRESGDGLLIGCALARVARLPPNHCIGVLRGSGADRGSWACDAARHGNDTDLPVGRQTYSGPRSRASPSSARFRANLPANPRSAIRRPFLRPQRELERLRYPLRARFLLGSSFNPTDDV